MDGKKEGLYLRWNQWGRKFYEENYKDGKKNALAIEWGFRGKRIEKNYKNGKEDGVCTWWDGDGNVIVTKTYKDGEVVE